MSLVCEQTLSSLESKKEDFERHKTRLAVVREEKDKRKLHMIGKTFYLLYLLYYPLPQSKHCVKYDIVRLALWNIETFLRKNDIL